MEFANIDRLDQLQGLLAGREALPADEGRAAGQGANSAPTGRLIRHPSGQDA
jgi:hypothetical protein